MTTMSLQGTPSQKNNVFDNFNQFFLICGLIVFLGVIVTLVIYYLVRKKQAKKIETKLTFDSFDSVSFNSKI